MKKLFDKGLIFQAIGLVLLAMELLIASGSLDKLNILTYLLVIGIVPAAILFICSLLHGVKTTKGSGFTYATALIMALVFSGAMFAFCSMTITPELVDTILANSITSETTQVSMTTASAGDNIQSVLIYIAFSGAGAFIGNRIRAKKSPAKPEKEYD